MANLIITKAGKLFRLKDNKKQRVKQHELGNVLTHVVSLEPGLTLGKFFSGLLDYGHLVDTLFTSHLFDHPFDMFALEALSRAKPVKKCDYLSRLVVEWRTDIYDEGGRKTFASWPHFAGEGPCPNNKEELCDYSVALTSLASIKHLPLVLDPIYTISELVVDKKKKKNKRVLYFEADKAMTLFDFVGAILHEISYHGTPAQRDKLSASIMEDETI